MPTISNKKRRFIEKNYNRLSIQELSHKTGLTGSEIKSVVDKHAAKTPGKKQQLPRELFNEDALLKVAWGVNCSVVS